MRNPPELDSFETKKRMNGAGFIFVSFFDEKKFFNFQIFPPKSF